MTNSPTKPTTKSKPATGSRTTKKNQLIKLLGTKSGADIKSLSEKLGWQTEAFQDVVRRVLEQIADPVALGALYNALLNHRVADDFNAKSLNTTTHATPAMRLIQASSKQVSTERLEEYLNERRLPYISQFDLVHWIQKSMHANPETIRHKMLELGWQKVSVKWGGVDYARVVWLRPDHSAQRGEVVAPDGSRQPIRDEVEINL